MENNIWIWKTIKSRLFIVNKIIFLIGNLNVWFSWCKEVINYVCNHIMRSQYHDYFVIIIKLMPNIVSLEKHTLTVLYMYCVTAVVVPFSSYTTVKDQSVITVMCTFVVVLLPESQGDGWRRVCLCSKFWRLVFDVLHNL